MVLAWFEPAEAVKGTGTGIGIEAGMVLTRRKVDVLGITPFIYLD